MAYLPGVIRNSDGTFTENVPYDKWLIWVNCQPFEDERTKELFVRLMRWKLDRYPLVREGVAALAARGPQYPSKEPPNLPASYQGLWNGRTPRQLRNLGWVWWELETVCSNLGFEAAELDFYFAHYREMEGLPELPPEPWSYTPQPKRGPANIEGQLLDLILELRSKFRHDKDYARSDQIRKSLNELGIYFNDNPDGTWEVEGTKQ